MVLARFYDDEDDGEDNRERDDDDRDDRGHPDPGSPVQGTPTGRGEHVSRVVEGCLLVRLWEEGGRLIGGGDYAVSESRAVPQRTGRAKIRSALDTPPEEVLQQSLVALDDDVIHASTCEQVVHIMSVSSSTELPFDECTRRS